jgi:hypothetical protein
MGGLAIAYCPKHALQCRHARANPPMTGDQSRSLKPGDRVCWGDFATFAPLKTSNLNRSSIGEQRVSCNAVNGAEMKVQWLIYISYFTIK